MKLTALKFWRALAYSWECTQNFYIVFCLGIPVCWAMKASTHSSFWSETLIGLFLVAVNLSLANRFINYALKDR